MVRRLPRAVRIGLALILFAILYPAALSWWESTLLWVPLDVPISLTQGHSPTFPFRVNVAGSYTIYVEGNWGVPGPPCFVGPRCTALADLNGVAVSWSLFNGERLVAQGDSTRNERGWSATDLGTFRADKGRYSLELNVRQDGSRFNSASPRLVVYESGGLQSEVGSWLGRAFLLSLLAAAAGIFLLIHSTVEWRREKLARRARELFLTQPGPQPRGLQMSPKPWLPDWQAGSPFRLAVWTGAFLVFSGLAGYVSVYRWRAAKIFVPVDMPVSLRAGHIHTDRFRMNLPDDYSIRLEGVYSTNRSGSCRDPWAAWTLYQGGEVAGRWVEQAYPGAYFSNAHISRAGIYDLDVYIRDDTQCFGFDHPRLKVFADSSDYDNVASRLLWLCALGMGAGVTLVVMAGSRSHRKSPSPVAPTERPGTPYGRVRWKPKPPERPFAGMPAFGLVAPLIVLLIFIVCVVFQAASRRLPAGLPVHLWRPGVFDTATPGLQPLLIRIEAANRAAPPRLFIDSEAVPWSELSTRLEKGLMRRPPHWPVYLDGDPSMDWLWAVQVIDAARGLNAEVYLYTRRTGPPPDSRSHGVQAGVPVR